MSKAIKRIDDIYRGPRYGEYLQRIEAVQTALDNLHNALYRVTEEVIDATKEERKAKRQEIYRSHPSSAKIKFSNKVLVMASSATGVVIRWSTMWRQAKSEDPRGKTRFTNVKTNGGAVRKSTLLAGAHPDEHKLLIQHEEQVRALKEGWARLADVRRTVRKLKYHSEPTG